MDETINDSQLEPIIAQSNGMPVKLYKSKAQLIEANLMGLKAASLKKQFAQQLFYDNTQSPLKRYNTGNRGPVHRRLGLRVMLRPNNGSQFERRFAPYNQFGVVRMRRTPYNYSQQFRIYRAREGITKLYSENYMRSIPPKVLQRQNTRWLERSAATQSLQAGGCQMSMPNQNPLNYTIEIQNNNCSTTPNTYYPQTFKHSIRAQLNQTLQEQIRLVQAECVSVSLSPIDIIPTLPGGATKLSLHDRFTAMD